jgi:hypothetical protein
MDELKATSAYYKLCLLTGLVEVQEVIAWADAIIMAEDAPDISLIEVSMAGSRGLQALTNALEDVRGDYDKERVTKSVFTRMLDLTLREERSPAQIARALFVMAAEGEVPDDDARSIMMGFDEELSWAQNGSYEYVKSLETEMIQFLRQNAQ